MAICLLLLVGMGCGVQKSMRVRDGIDPQYQDDDVRFRTYYYFRVVDILQDDGCNETGKLHPNCIAKDTLYRFRMTGKANEFTNKVHFESGTLSKSQIDPFGSSMVYDETKNRFVYESTINPESIERDRELASLSGLMADIEKACSDTDKTLSDATCKELKDKLLARYDAVLNGSTDSVNASRKAELEALLDDLATLKGKEGQKNADKKAIDDARKAVEKRLASLVKDDTGTPARQSFYILGPEGWREFDQDERLLLAMSSSGKPLIGAMQQLSRKLLDQPVQRAEAVMWIAKERLNVRMAEDDLKEIEKPEDKSAVDMADSVLKRFGATSKKEDGK